MNREGGFAGFPERVGVGTNRPGAYYVRLPGRHAVHHLTPTQDVADAEMIFRREGIAVFRGEPAEPPSHQPAVTPVYKLHPDGPVAVPTGRVFVRFNEGVNVATRREEIERAGYEIIETPPYAPSCAWVQSASGDLALALRDIHNLERLPDVENVEPQMLSERGLRGG